MLHRPRPEVGRTSWTTVLDAVRLAPAGDATAITATQLRTVVERLMTAGQRNHGGSASSGLVVVLAPLATAVNVDRCWLALLVGPVRRSVLLHR